MASVYGLEWDTKDKRQDNDGLVDPNAVSPEVTDMIQGRMKRELQGNSNEFDNFLKLMLFIIMFLVSLGVIGAIFVIGGVLPKP